VSTGKEGQVCWQLLGKWFVKSNSERSFTGKLQQAEGTDVNQSNLCWVSSRLVHQEANRNHKLIDVALSQDVVHKERILFKELPQQDE
jgi:hypothetical protein